MTCLFYYAIMLSFIKNEKKYKNDIYVIMYIINNHNLDSKQYHVLNNTL